MPLTPGLRGLLTKKFEPLDNDPEEEQQGDGGDEGGQQILAPGERDDHRVLRKDALIQLPDEGEDQDQDLHQPHHHQEAVKNVTFFQRIVKIEESGHVKDGFSVLGFGSRVAFYAP